MKDGKSGRRLIVNADDFGCDSGINGAVIDAHRHGVLTTASLMVNEPGFEEAVALARENPLIYATSYALGSLLLKLDMQELPPRIAQRSRLSITTSTA